MTRKSIVLSDLNANSNKKAVLSLEEDGVGLHGNLRLYNFSHELDGVSSLGFYVEKQVYKAGLTKKGQMFYEFFLSLDKVPDRFSCAVVNFQNAVATPILYGSNDGNNENVYGSIIDEISRDSTVKNTQAVLDKYAVNFDADEQKEIEKEIDNALCSPCEACANCVYKKFFFEHQDAEKTQPQQSKTQFDWSAKERQNALKNEQKQAASQETWGAFERNDTLFDENLTQNSHYNNADIDNSRVQKFERGKTLQNGADFADNAFESAQKEKVVNFKQDSNKKNFEQSAKQTEQHSGDKAPQQEVKKANFVDRLMPQIDKLFQTNPIEDNLQSLIPSSKWVKVDYEDDGDFFVFGLLYGEDGDIKFVCYGVPAVFEEEPPQELSGFPIWLPLDKNNAKGFGYWLTYQDAATGEPVKAILD